MKADEAKKLALQNKKQMEVNLEIKKETALNKDVDLLLGFFNTKIEEAVSKGKLGIEPVEFPADRFSNDVITEVAFKLKNDGYQLVMAKNIAYQKTKFNIGWA